MSLHILPTSLRISALACSLALLPCLPALAADKPAKTTALTGQAAFTDAAHEAPGTRRHLTWADLPLPAPDQSVDNGPSIVPRPANAWPVAPKGFKVDLYATGLDNPRLLRVAPMATSSSQKARLAKSGSFAAQALTASPCRPPSSPPDSISPSA